MKNCLKWEMDFLCVLCFSFCCWKFKTKTKHKTARKVMHALVTQPWPAYFSFFQHHDEAQLMLSCRMSTSKKLALECKTFLRLSSFCVVFPKHSHECRVNLISLKLGRIQESLTRFEAIFISIQVIKQTNTEKSSSLWHTNDNKLMYEKKCAG